MNGICTAQLARLKCFQVIDNKFTNKFNYMIVLFVTLWDVKQHNCSYAAHFMVFLRRVKKYILYKSVFFLHLPRPGFMYTYYIVRKYIMQVKQSWAYNCFDYYFF